MKNILDTIPNYTSVVDYIRKTDMKNDQSLNALEYYGNIISKREYWKYVNRYRNYFYNLGIKEGEPVAICMLNSPEYEFIFCSLLENGNIASTVSKSFLNADLKAQTLERNIKTLILSIEFLPELIEHKTFEQIFNSNTKEHLERIIFTTAGNYRLPNEELEYNKRDFRTLINSLNLPKTVEIIYPGETKNTIEKTTDIELSKPYLMEKLATYSNTGGTTGAPKCATHTHKGITSLLMSHRREIYKEFNLKEHSRSLLVIPISHITSQFYGLLIRRASNANIIYHPGVFEPEVLRQVLLEEEIDDTVLPFGLYYAITRKPFEPGTLKLNTPLCGGEPYPYKHTKEVNEILVKGGGQKAIMGTGSTEFGSGFMATYGIEDRVNESGYYFPFAKGFALDPYTDEIITEPGKRGILYSFAPWQMEGYLNNEKATNDFYHYKASDGTVYGTNNDIVEIAGEYKGQLVYSMLGRSVDFVMGNGKTYYPAAKFTNGKVNKIDFEKGKFLFDLRDTMLNIEGVMEVQPIIVPLNKQTEEGHVVINITVHPSFNTKEILKKAYEEFKKQNDLIPTGIVFRTRFARSLSSDKREVLSLTEEKLGYYYIDENDILYNVELTENGEILTQTNEEIKILEPPAPKLVYSKLKK